MRKALLALLPFYLGTAHAAEVLYDVDIPASESEEEVQEPLPPITYAPQPTLKMEKRAEAAPVVAVNVKPDDKKLSEWAATPSNMVVLQGLNKVIGRVSTLEVPLGTLANFENLQIIARKCVKSPPDERPENAALLEILEIKTGEEPKQVFFGWMLSSSPGLSALEHPVYDITVLSCEFKNDLEN